MQEITKNINSDLVAHFENDTIMEEVMRTQIMTSFRRIMNEISSQFITAIENEIKLTLNGLNEVRVICLNRGFGTVWCIVLVVPAQVDGGAA